MDDPPWVQLTIVRVQVEPRDALLRPYESGLAVVLGDADPDLSEGASSQTWAMAVTMNVLFEDESPTLEVDPAEFVTLAFERCLAAVNRLSQASRLVTGETDTRPLSKDSLDPYVAWFDKEVDDLSEELGERHEITLHSRRYNPLFAGYNPLETHGLLGDAVGRSLAADATAQAHPFLVPRALALEARGQLRRGEATASVVTLQTAAEGVLRGLHRLILLDAGTDSAEIDEQDSGPFETLVRTHLPGALGGRWSGPDAAPEKYMTHVYGLRNRIVHAGRAPEWRELAPAYASYDALMEFLDGRIRSKWRSIPRTLKAWCDRWAGGTGELPRAARPVADALERETAPYWLPADLAGR